MGLIKRVKELEKELAELKQKIIFLEEKSVKNEHKIDFVNNRIDGLNDYQKEIIEQNKKSQEDRTILLREYLNGGEEEV